MVCRRWRRSDTGGRSLVAARLDAENGHEIIALFARSSLRRYKIFAAKSCLRRSIARSCGAILNPSAHRNARQPPGARAGELAVGLAAASGLRTARNRHDPDDRRPDAGSAAGRDAAARDFSPRRLKRRCSTARSIGGAFGERYRNPSARRVVPTACWRETIRAMAGEPVQRRGRFAEGARVATGSMRRQAQLLRAAARPGVAPMRGNVGTRIDKSRAVKRTQRCSQSRGSSASVADAAKPSSIPVFLPAVGQGLIALRCARTRRDPTLAAKTNQAPNHRHHHRTRSARGARRLVPHADRGLCER